MTRREMIRQWLWLMNRGDHEAAKEIEWAFADTFEESIFDYV